MSTNQHTTPHSHHHDANARYARPFGHAADHLTLLAPDLVRREDECTCDPKVYHPVCPDGCDNCVQRLVALPCGRSCPDNYCVNDGSNKGATIGGAVGGVLGGLILLALGYWWYRSHTSKQKAAAAEQARNEARRRAIAAEKFRPGAAGRQAQSPAETSVPMPDHHDEQLWQQPQQPQQRAPAETDERSPGMVTSGSTHCLEQHPDEEEDVEYTELRSDGLTMYHRPEPDTQDQQPTTEEQSDLNPLNKRFSTSAATHLSRISERTEYDDEMRSMRSRLTQNKLPRWSQMPSLPGPASRSVLSVPPATNERPRSSKSATKKPLKPVQTTTTQQPIIPEGGEQGQEQAGEADPFADSHSILQQVPNPSPEPSTDADLTASYLAVPGTTAQDQRPLSTGTMGSSTSGVSGCTVQSAVPAMVTRVQLQKPGKVELVRRPSGGQSAGTTTTSKDATSPSTATMASASALGAHQPVVDQPV